MARLSEEQIEVLRDALADAWDKGHEWQCEDVEGACRDMHLTANPYRAESQSAHETIVCLSCQRARPEDVEACSECGSRSWRLRGGGRPRIGGRALGTFW